jgi:CP family cyanate transporter-like MFS transporter
MVSVLVGAAWLLLATKPAYAAEGAVAVTAPALPSWTPWRSREVWLASALYAGQGIVFFLLGSWLPAIHAEAGFSQQASGTRMLVLAAASVPGVLVVPRWAGRTGSLRLPFIWSAAIVFAGTLGYFLAPVIAPVDLLWAMLTGFGVGGILVLALAFAAETGPASRTSETAAMVLAVGYSVTALGPLVGGIATDVGDGVRSALLLPPVVATAMLLLAFALPATTGQTAGAGTETEATEGIDSES